MKKLNIVMLGAGSGFVLSIAKELIHDPIFTDAEFRLVDTAPDRLAKAEEIVKEIFEKADHPLHIVSTTDRRKALEGADYVISSCEKNRYANWALDLGIPEKHGVYQIKGENGGPGGLIHSLRNISMYRQILDDMVKYCPNARLMNFTNPMSTLCTFFRTYEKVKCLGFCHQVHGSFGLIAELLGYEPGEFEVISAGVNHLNWLFDIRHKGSNQSCMEEFLTKVGESKYWKEHFKNIPSQFFTYEVLKTFGVYPIGYDDHIIEYMSFFYEKPEWDQYGYKALTETYANLAKQKSHILETTRLLGKDYEKPPFPVDPDHPYYAENPCAVIKAFETNTPLYFDAIVTPNCGAVDNLPKEAVLDVPAVAIGGEVRTVHVGALPPGPLEICRRQVALHEMIVQAANEGSHSLAVQALCLDPYVHSITQARAIWKDYYETFKDDLTDFQ